MARDRMYVARISLEEWIDNLYFSGSNAPEIEKMFYSCLERVEPLKRLHGIGRNFVKKR